MKNLLEKKSILILCLFVFTVMCGQLYSAEYTIVFENKSSMSGRVCLFQKDPNGSPGVFSLAWFTKYSNPDTIVKFVWETNYSFVWSETGQLRPGVVFMASQSLPASLSTQNQVTFTSMGGAYTFRDQTQGPQPGTLLIKKDGSIPSNRAAVGIGMSGAGTFVVQAQPNYNLRFQSNPEYWIAFGNFRQGEVLDTNLIPNAARVNFPGGIYSMTATLNPDMTWTIQ